MAGQWDRRIAPRGTTLNRPGILIYKVLMPLSLHVTQRNKVLAAEQVGLYAPLNPPPLAQRGS